MHTDAILSECGKYRYTLERQWNVQRNWWVWLMLNPSTADARTDDATIRRLIGFTHRGGGGGFKVVNLYAFRATDKYQLAQAIDPIGPDNDHAIATTLVSPVPSKIVVACGDGPDHRTTLSRLREVLGAIDRASELMPGPVCLGTTRAGLPKHPVRLPYDLDYKLYACP